MNSGLKIYDDYFFIGARISEYECDLILENIGFNFKTLHECEVLSGPSSPLPNSVSYALGKHQPKQQDLFLFE